MQIISKSTEFVLEKKSAVAIGKFDGIHRGHLALLHQILEQKAQGMQAVVFTFDPPATVFFGKEGEKELTTLHEKRRIFEMLGVDVLIEFPLNKETAAIEAEDFVKEILVKRINAGYIAAGYDLSFGYKGRGNSELLISLAENYDYRVEIIEKLLFGEREISSTYVREETLLGHMDIVKELLGRPYSIAGKVEEGKKLGRTLGMPTVNLYPPEGKLLPKNGVYYSQTCWNGTLYKSITNIGLKPTVNDSPTLSVESYLYDFQGDLYGEEIETYLLAFKRPEMKFGSVADLKAQMLADVEDGRNW